MVYNRICNYCGNKYYACSNCISINSWKNFCCSTECWRNLITTNKEVIPIEMQGSVDMTKALLRGEFVKGGTISIVGYDLELGKFDCSDGETHTFDEFNAFIIPVAEMKEISEKLNDKIEKSKKVSKKAVVEETLKTDL